MNVPLSVPFVSAPVAETSSALSDIQYVELVQSQTYNAAKSSLNQTAQEYQAIDAKPFGVTSTDLGTSSPEIIALSNSRVAGLPGYLVAGSISVQTATSNSPEPLTSDVIVQLCSPAKFNSASSSEIIGLGSSRAADSPGHLVDGSISEQTATSNSPEHLTSDVVVQLCSPAKFNSASSSEIIALGNSRAVDLPGPSYLSPGPVILTVNSNDPRPCSANVDFLNGSEVTSHQLHHLQ